MLPILFIGGAGLFLAYVNGANDNFKGVATLYGSDSASYGRALGLATIATLLGSLAALFAAQTLLMRFSGKGLVDEVLLQHPAFALAAGLGAAATILLATLLGFPVSTTHALTGALVGAGLAAGSVHFARLGALFFLPLLLSPLLAILAAAGLYPLLRHLRRHLSVEEDTCVCVGQPLALRAAPLEAAAAALEPAMAVASAAECRVRYGGWTAALHARRTLDALHYLSGGLVSFARGLNDTPKIAALLLMGSVLGSGSHPGAIVGVAAGMALGGLLSARKVAHKMSREVTALNAGQGATANLVTSALVLGASHLGVPVSTTHVSCGALFGIGWTTGQGRWKTMGSIVAAWVITLPAAALSAASIYLLAS